MATDLHSYSRLVFWLKIILPILALVALSTLFLFARHIDYEGNLPFAEVDIEGMANDPRLTQPEYATMTADGTAVKVAAATARPGAGAADPVEIDDVLALYDRAAGSRLSVQADRGTYDAAGAMLHLQGDVLLTTSDGYKLSADRLASSLARTEITAEGSVVTEGPLGRIEAGELRLTGQESHNRLVFNKGVRLLYKPGH